MYNKSKIKIPRLSERSIVFIFFLSLFSIALLLGLQGFDMCDEGWVITGYQQFFNDPSSIQYLFLFYISQFVGGVWNCFLGGMGIYAFRILSSLVMLSTLGVVYVIFRHIYPLSSIFIGLLAVFFLSNCGIIVFHHNHLTAFFSVVISCILLHSLLERNHKKAFFAGLFIGINVFCRLPNTTLIMLILTIIPFYWHNRDWTQTKRMILYIIFGFLLGILLVVGLMMLLGHFSLFTATIYSLFFTGKDTDSTHNILTLITVYIRNYRDIGISFLKTWAFPVLLYLLCKSKLSLYVKYFAGILYVFFFLSFPILRSFNGVYSLYSISTIVCTYVLIKNKKVEEVYLAYLSLIIMYVLPLGSDFGIGNMGSNCVWIAVPFSVGVIERKMRTINPNKLRYIMALCFILPFLNYARSWVVEVVNQCYFDTGNRWEKTYLIDNPLATTYTTRHNCEMLNPLLLELSHYVKEEDELFCFQSIATIHFLTKTKPYLYNPWIWTYSPINFERAISKALKERHVLPVIVRDKSRLPKWYEYYSDWNNEHAKETFIHKNGRIRLMNAFQAKYGYRVVWENDVFQILLPPNYVGFNDKS